MSSEIELNPQEQQALQVFVEDTRDTIDKLVFELNGWQNDFTLTQPIREIFHHLKTIHHEAQGFKLVIFNQQLEDMIVVCEQILKARLHEHFQAYGYLLFALDECYKQLNHLVNHETCPVNIELKKSFEALIPFQPSPSMETIEPVVPIDIFHEELIEILDILALQVNQISEDASSLDEVKRALHTLKGSARLVGFKPLGDFVHEVEDKVDQNRPEQNTQMIAQLIEYLRANEQNILNKLNILPTWQALEAIVINEQEETSHHENLIETIDRLRLPLGDVERFSQLAATANITRAHIEQQQSSLKNYTQTLFETITRLEEQTRALQVQADATLEYSSHFNKASHEYDPLEMDRYTKLQHHVREIHDLHSTLFGLHDDMEQSLQDIQDSVREQYHAAHALEEGLTHIRMVAVESIIPRLKSMVDQISNELNKDVKLEVVEAQGDLDRSVLEKLIPSLEHMLRNAIDHGIEPRQARLDQGKASVGHLKIAIIRKGAHIIITLSDDGRGIDLEAIKRKAIEQNWWHEDYEPTEKDLINMIYVPGFSTMSETTIVSGRGIGMDVVHSQIRKLGGSLKVDTQANQGTTFSVQLPFTTSLNKALIIQNEQQLYGMLLSHIAAITRVDMKTLEAVMRKSGVFHYMGKSFPLYYIGHLLGQQSFDNQLFTKKALPVLLIESQDLRFAVIVDKVLGSREVLLKSLGPQMQTLSQLLGASVLGDGAVALILDPSGLVERDIKVIQSKQTMTKKLPKIMVVDDSITVRKVTTKLLERHHFHVLCAKDGMHALDSLEHFMPECILLDLEMPRMDGYTFLEVIRKDGRFKEIPVIVISSRGVDKYKKRAYELGANCFISKPYKEDVLLTYINKLIKAEDESSTN